MKTLLATDGSAHSQLAEALVVKIPCLKKSSVLAVSVASPPLPLMAPIAPMGEMVYAQQLSDIWDQVRKTGETVASDSADRLRAAGVQAEGQVIEGMVAESLIDLAAKEQCDTIVIGSRGEGSIRAFFLGSVARRLTSDSPQSVLIGRPDEDKTVEETLERLKSVEKLRVVIAFDGTDGAAEAVKIVSQNGRDAFAESFVICAEPLSGLPLGLSPTLYESTLRYEHEQAKAAVSDAAHRLSQVAIHTVAEVKVGRPGDVICDSARRHKADLVIIGATRHGRLERVLLGSVADEVATNAPCSVFIVRSR